MLSSAVLFARGHSSKDVAPSLGVHRMVKRLVAWCWENCLEEQNVLPQVSALESRGEHSTDRKVLHRGSAFRVPVCRGQRDRGKPCFEHQRVGGWNELSNLSMVCNGDSFPLF